MLCRVERTMVLAIRGDDEGRARRDERMGGGREPWRAWSDEAERRQRRRIGLVRPIGH